MLDSSQSDCPGCGAPDDYPPAGPCLDHGHGNAVADVPGVTSCIDCGRRLDRYSQCPACETDFDPYDLF